MAIIGLASMTAACQVPLSLFGLIRCWSSSAHYGRVGKGRNWMLLAVCAQVIAACGGGSSSDSVSDQSVPELALALPDANGIGFIKTEMTVAENQRSLLVSIFRSGDAVTDSSVSYAVQGGTAEGGTDFSPLSGSVSWAAGETGIKTFALTVYSDAEAEVVETLDLTLTQLSGTDLIAQFANATVSLLDAACTAVIVAQTSGSVHLAEPCYRMMGQVNLGRGDRLSSVPGATVVAETGAGFVVNQGASIQLEGTADRPVMLRGATAQPGVWSGLELRDADAPGNTLSYTVIRDAEIGLTVNKYSVLEVFSNNQITANSVAALSIPVRLAGKLDAESSLVGNSRDYVILQTDILDNEHRLPAIDIPYLTQGNIVVNGRLSLAAGVELHFGQSDFLIVSTTGTLLAIGTVNQPILFSAERQSAGYWDGIHFLSSVNGASRLDYVTVSYGGGDATHPGNIALYGGAPNIKITNSTLSHSIAHGIWVDANQANLITDGTVFLNNQGDDIFYN